MIASDRIVLIGFMGCGKSTLGAALAEKLQWSFLDTDDWIEKEMGMAISDIFDTLGDWVFREKESEALAFALQQKNAIIATGGGLPCNSLHIDSIKKHSTSFYLQLPAEDALKRLRNETEHRPLLTELAEEELLPWIQQKIEYRNYFYKQADFVLDVRKNVAELVNEVSLLLENGEEV